MENERYYFGQLSKPQQQVYHEMLTGLKEISPSFSVLWLSNQELTDIFFFLRLDHPEIFYVSGFRWRACAQAERVELLPEYLFKKKQIEEQRTAIDARIRKLVRPAEQLSEEDKEQYIHDFICSNVHYDKLEKQYSHEIIGPLVQGIGVCEGIAKTVRILCDHLGLNCVIAIAESNPEKGIRYRHAWNVIRIGGKYRHLDATFDLSLSRPKEIRYDYFNINDTWLYRDHESLVRPVPPCEDYSRSWYISHKLSLTKQEDVRRRLQQAAKKGKTFTFQWRGNYLTRKVLLELCTILDEEALAAGKSYTLSLNWPQSVLRVEFFAKEQGSSVAFEHANEAENTMQPIPEE